MTQRSISRGIFLKKMIPYLFVAPAIIIFVLYMFIPLLQAFIMSFYDWSIAGKEFIGLTNYKNLFQDKLFKTTIVNTLVYTLAVPFKTVLALVIAALLSNVRHFQGFYRSTLFFPYILSGVVVGLIWQMMFSVDSGFINMILSFFGLSQKWLVESDHAMWVLWVVGTWQGLGSNLILFLAGIKGISTELYEAASMDGANSLQQFVHITIPCLKPVTIFVVTMLIIGSFKIFDLAYIMTGGGPGDSTRTLVQFIYDTAFERFKMGYASAAAYIFFVILIILTLLQKKILVGGDK